MSRRKITIGLFGFGCVGYGLYEVLGKTNGLKANIKRICIKNPNKQRPIDATHFTFNKNDILNDPDINVVVELIDDADAAYEIVVAALQKGKAVVTANKKMIAEHFTELLELQRKYDVPLLYEAACCASIPIIRNLEEYYDNDLLESIEGIVNGSTNYILTKTFSEGKAYQEALQEAQEKGYAESNPILDIGGYDAKYKLLLLLAHAFGVVVQPEAIFNLGINNLGDLELNYAKEKNLKIKLVARAYKFPNGNVAGFVMPQFVSSQEKLFAVDDVYNGVMTKTSFADTQFFMGKGAGAHPTASAVLSDISALSYHYRYEYKKLQDVVSLEQDEKVNLKIFLRHNNQQTPQLLNYFTHIEACYSNLTAAYIIGTLTLVEVKLLAAIEEVSIVLMDVMLC